MSNNKRVMIIVWWWSYGGLGEDSDKWLVSDTSAEDCVVRIDQRFSPNAKSIIASNAVKHLEDSEVFIFLHRNHGYNGQAIEDILAEIKKHHPDASNVRCFSLEKETAAST